MITRTKITNRLDPHNLERFVRAQDARGAYRQAMVEMVAGKKVGHWIWFILPRLIGPNYSPTSEYYALPNRWAARAYLQHPVLGPRLVACAEAVLGVRNRTLLDIFGSVDAPKVRQCAELFASLNVDPIFLSLLCKP